MKNDMWAKVDFDSTIKDFEFTRKAINEIHSVVYSGDFEDMDADMIFSYLQGKMQIVSFKDFLRRYLYSEAQIQEPFYSVQDDVYRDIIMESFEESFTPHSVEPTTKRWSAIVKGWLSSESVRRPTMFLIGFGLRMKETEVSEFLTKVLKEEDFNPVLPQEVICHYCYRNQLPWSFAKKKQEWYQNVEVNETDAAEKISDSQMPLLADEEELDHYLLSLKKTHGDRREDDTAYQVFLQLMDRAKRHVARIYCEDEELGNGREWTKEDISPADLEKIICCGIPVTDNGNLQKMSASLLNRHFNQKRLSRQRIEKIEHRQAAVDRFDLITLLFFIYSQEMSEDEPEIRCMNYLDEINFLLGQCYMSGLYPVNAYEAFILMCLLSEVPLSTYSEIWEMSFRQE